MQYPREEVLHLRWGSTEGSYLEREVHLPAPPDSGARSVDACDQVTTVSWME